MLRSSIREAYENGRIIVFIEPIALYMKKDLYEDKDGSWASVYPPLGEEVSLGEFKVYGRGQFLTIVTYGNGVYLSLKAKNKFEKRYKKK